MEGFVKSVNMTNEVHWYALKVFYNKVFEIRDLLTEMAVESYIPVTHVEIVRAGKRKVVEKPAVNSLMFFRASEKLAYQLQIDLEGRAFVYHYINSTRPIAIDDHEMQIFMFVTRADDKYLEYLDADATRYCQGQRVRVTGGQFEGAEGYIKRIQGNRRLIVCIEGIVAVATSYIPSCLLEPIND